MKKKNTKRQKEKRKKNGLPVRKGGVRHDSVKQNTVDSHSNEIASKEFLLVKN